MNPRDILPAFPILAGCLNVGFLGWVADHVVLKKPLGSSILLAIAVLPPLPLVVVLLAQVTSWRPSRVLRSFMRWRPRFWPASSAPLRHWCPTQDR